MRGPVGYGYVASRYKQRAAPGSPTIQPLIEPLSSREIEAFNLVAAGLSNQEIIVDERYAQRRGEHVASIR